MASNLRWLPLESNPDVMNKCLRSLGVCEEFGVYDIYSLDHDFFNSIPQPSLAVLLLFPITKKYEEYCASAEERMRSSELDMSNIFFMKQTIHNACGTIAVLHALANNEKLLNLPKDSIFKKFLNETRDMTPYERGKHLEDSMEIGTLHEEGAQTGQTEAPNLDDDINLHFVALVEVDGKLIELDGRKSMPIVHGETQNFLMDALRVVNEYIAREPENMNFTAMTFSSGDLTLDD